MRFDIKKFKSFQGHEGMGFNLELWVDGVKACFVIDDANGGEAHYRWLDRGIMARVKAHVDALPIVPSVTEDEKSLWPQGRKQDMDGFVDCLINEFAHDRRLRRLCKTKTVFRLPTDKPDIFHTLNVPYPEGRRHIPANAEVLNEKYL